MSCSPISITVEHTTVDYLGTTLRKCRLGIGDLVRVCRELWLLMKVRWCRIGQRGLRQL